MVIDSQSFNDISIFHTEEEFSIFHKLNFTRTIGGKEWLRKFFSEPHNDIEKDPGYAKGDPYIHGTREPMARRNYKWNHPCDGEIYGLCTGSHFGEQCFAE